MKVLVTGASGNVGREVVRALGARGIAVRAAGRAGGPPFEAGGAEAAPFDFFDRETFRPALRGCDGLFLLRPPAIRDVRPTLNALVDDAEREGVRHVVFLSVAGAGTNRLVPHHGVEARLRHGPGADTVLRPGFFAQNLGDAYRRDVVEDGRLYVPAGRGAAAFVDVRDVAEVAALAFADRAAHAARAYTLTGPEGLTFAEAARILSGELGRPVRYEPASVFGYVRHLAGRGLPAAQVAVQTALHVGIRFGQAAEVDPTLGRLLGRPARTLRDYVRDHVTLWQAAAGPTAAVAGALRRRPPSPPGGTVPCRPRARRMPTTPAGRSLPAALDRLAPAGAGRWVERTHWDRSEHAGSFRIEPELSPSLRRRFACEGTYRLEPIGPSSTQRVVEGRLGIDAPGLGPLVERALVALIARQFAGETRLLGDLARAS